jgi:hypothetical protein
MGFCYGATHTLLLMSCSGSWPESTIDHVGSWPVIVNAFLVESQRDLLPEIVDRPVHIEQVSKGHSRGAAEKEKRARLDLFGEIGVGLINRVVAPFWTTAVASQ